MQERQSTGQIRVTSYLSTEDRKTVLKDSQTRPLRKGRIEDKQGIARGSIVVRLLGNAAIHCGSAYFGEAGAPDAAYFSFFRGELSARKLRRLLMNFGLEGALR